MVALRHERGRVRGATLPQPPIMPSKGSEEHFTEPALEASADPRTKERLPQEDCVAATAGIIVGAVARWPSGWRDLG